MLAIAIGLATPAGAQFSDSFNFLKAVKDKDGAKATEYLKKPGNTVVNVKDSDSGETALHIVTRRQDATWLGFLLGNGANPDARDRDGNTALLLAAQTRWADGAATLLSVKAQPNGQNRLGETPLLKATQNRDVTMAELLVKAGANPDITDNSGVTARSLAATDARASGIARLFKDLPVRTAKPAQGPSL